MTLGVSGGVMPGLEAVIFVEVDVAVWAVGLDELHERIGKRFGQAAPLAYLQRCWPGWSS
jgi:phage terminase large subunit GpA-like protein